MTPTDPASSGAVDPRPFLVEPDDSLRDAVVLMQENSRGVAVVAGPDGEVVGTLTDVDVRRAVLDGADATTPVARAMAAPVTVDAAATGDEVGAAARAAGAGVVAVVDGRRVVGVHVPAPDRAPATSAVIMAGGRGQRLRPLTDKVPKPLLKVGTSSILERLIRSLAGVGVRHVHLSVNYKAEVFEERFGDGSHLGVRIDYLRERKPLGTAGALSLLEEPPAGPFLVMNADMVTALDFARMLDFHRAEGAAVTVGAFEHAVQIPYGVLDIGGRRLRGVEEKPTRRSLCNAGVYVLDPDVLRLVPPNTFFDMPDLLDGVLAESRPVAVFPILEKFFDIGSPEEFERVLIWFATGEEE